MKIEIITLFPEMFREVFSSSILKRAQQEGFINIVLHQLRDFTLDKHRKVDDYPFGGGAGMLMQPQPFFDNIESILAKVIDKPHLVYLSPSGKPLQQRDLQRLSEKKHLIVLCGHYEGIDQRVIDTFVDEEISLGDFVLTGGEIPAMALVDGISRLIPGVLGHAESTEEESFSDGLLEYPHYSRPAVFRDLPVPSVLLAGDHGAIAHWRKKESLRRTLKIRPELLLKVFLKAKERQILAEILEEEC
jgi:tRNA (guanine37-N1)-methyltransferase